MSPATSRPLLFLRRTPLMACLVVFFLVLAVFPAAVSSADSKSAQTQTPARELHGPFWQRWTATAKASLARVDILAGTSGAACAEISGTLRISQVLANGQKVSLHSQPVSTTCSGAQLTLNTCVFAPACRRGAWLAWQQFSLVDAKGSQHYLSLDAGRSYVAELGFQSSGVAAAVQASTTPGTSSSLARNPQYNSFVVRLAFSEPGAVVTGSFSSVLLSAGGSSGDASSSSSSSSSTFSSPAVFGVLIALVSLIAVVLLFLIYRNVRKSSPGSSTSTSTTAAPVVEALALSPLHVGTSSSPVLRNRRGSLTDTFDEEFAIESPRRFSSSGPSGRPFMNLPGSHAETMA